MKNHQSRPTGSSPFPVANATSFPEMNATSFKRNHGRGRGRGPRRGRGHGRNNVWRRERHNLNQMTTIWGDMKMKRIQHLLKSLKVVVIDVV
jgi:hypothetical protein